MRTAALTTALLFLSAPLLAAPIAFDDQWQTQKFPFQADNDYALNGTSLGVVSDDSVSLVYRRTGDAAAAGSASWTWSVSEGVPATDLSVKGGDDRDLALYFVFSDTATAHELEGASLRSLLGAEKVRVLVYVWGGDSPKGTVLDSPYLGARGKTVILHGSGTGKQSEQVSFDADLTSAFGERPPVLLGVAVSADSDDTDSRIDATISDLTLD